MQNYVDNHQIDFHGYHSIENSRFIMLILASKNIHIKSYGGLKFWIIFGGSGFTNIKIFHIHFRSSKAHSMKYFDISESRPPKNDPKL